MKRKYDYKKIYPGTKKVRQIVSANITELATQEEETMFAVLQGLVNRDEPRVYLSHGHKGEPSIEPRDGLWVNYYEQRFGIPVTRLGDPYKLFDSFGDYVRGVIVYDAKMLENLHLAVMLCARQNCLPVTPKLLRQLKTKYAWAGNVVDDLRGRFDNGYECTLWAHKNIQPSCYPHMIAQRGACVPALYDYVVAHNLFLFHTSHSMKDRREAALADSIYQSADRPCHVMGWMDNRTQECEYTARTSKNGCFITCNGCPNLSLHAGIDVKPRYKPRRLTADRRKVQKKVYVAFVVSDGDALWCLNSFFVGGYNQKERGRFPITWEQQLVTYHLAPGMFQYYIEKATPNDYLISSTSGAGYTYPNLHPDPASYLKFTEKYMKLTGIRHIFAGISSPYHATYWRDPEDQRKKIVALYREHVPGARGIVRGYGGGGLLEEHSIEPGKTPVVCFTLMAGKHTKVQEEIDRVIASVDRRPLFISMHIAPWHLAVRGAFEVSRKLSEQRHEVLLLDEWFAKMESAIKKGWLDDGLYPNREDHLAAQRKHLLESWNKNLRRTFERVLKQSLLPDAKLEKMHKTFPRIWGNGQPLNEKKRTITTLEDDLAFTVLFTAQCLADFVCKCKGNYTNDLAVIRRFWKTSMKHVKDTEVMADCLTAWLNWEKRRITIKQAKHWARRMLRLLPRLDKDLAGGHDDRR